MIFDTKLAEGAYMLYADNSHEDQYFDPRSETTYFQTLLSPGRLAGLGLNFLGREIRNTTHWVRRFKEEGGETLIAVIAAMDKESVDVVAYGTVIYIEDLWDQMVQTHLRNEGY